MLSAAKKDAEAAAELQKALALRADDWDALRELAFVQERGKEYAAAEDSYRTLLTHFPNDAELYDGLGSVLLAQLKYAEAQNKFMACVRLRPEWGEALGQLALAAAGNKEYELAIKALDERKKLLAETPSSYFLRATCYDQSAPVCRSGGKLQGFPGGVASGSFPTMNGRRATACWRLSPRPGERDESAAWYCWSECCWPAFAGAQELPWRSCNTGRPGQRGGLRPPKYASRAAGAGGCEPALRQRRPEGGPQGNRRFPALCPALGGLLVAGAARAKKPRRSIFAS